MAHAKFTVPLPPNEPVKTYAPGTSERETMKTKLAELRSRPVEIPLIIGGKEVKTGNVGPCVLPHDHKTVVGTYHQAGDKEVEMAVQAALEAHKHWARMEQNDELLLSYD